MIAEKGMAGEGRLPPRVSVVVTTRNRLAWLQQCIASVEQQQGVAWELLIVDDASSDQTWDWLSQLISPQVRIHRFAQNCERCRARNQGLALASGEYVMFLDDDDWLWPGALKRLADALDKHGDAVAAVGARQAVFAAENYARRDAHPRRLRKRNIEAELLFGWSAVSGQNLYRTSVIRSVGGYEDEKLIPFEDRLLWLRVAALGFVVLVPEIVMSYRYHGGQVRPVDIQSARNAVAIRAIRAMPRSQWRRSLQLRRSGHLVEQAEEQMSHGNPLKALWLCARAACNTPAIFASVLIGEWVARRLAGRLYRRMFPVN